jgi:hypothetical protein
MERNVNRQEHANEQAKDKKKSMYLFIKTGRGM